MGEVTKTLNHSLSGSTSTPIRRRPSRGSLSAALLSASRSQSADAPPLSLLSSLFSDMADDLQDLTANFERLDALNNSLDTFNEAFASLLYGMKMNAFCEEFPEAPNKTSFDYAAKREAEKAALAASQTRSPTPPSSPTPSAGHSEPDATFQSHAGDRYGSRGGSIPRARGRGMTGAARGRAVAAKRKEKRLAFAAELLQTLPIKYREEQPHRGEMEQVISALREKPEGLYIPDIAAATKVPSHRVNEACLALKRAKHAITIAKGGLLYQLDPSRYPPEAA